jgi:hypothetical protein
MEQERKLSPIAKDLAAIYYHIEESILGRPSADGSELTEEEKKELRSKSPNSADPKIYRSLFKDVRNYIKSTGQDRLVPENSKANPAWADTGNNHNHRLYIFDVERDPIQLDHLYPLKTIIDDHSADLKRLPLEERLQVTNLIENYFLVSQSVNSSRQNNTYESWEGNNQQMLVANKKWKEDMANLEVAAKKAVSSKIADLLKNKKAVNTNLKKIDPCKEEKNERKP